MSAAESTAEPVAEPYVGDEVELLLFEVGGQRYGTDASQVLRIDRAASHAVTWPPLGSLRQGLRCLVFRSTDTEAQLRVDTVLGVRPVAVDTLRRLPPAASPDASLIGIWLDGDTPVMLVDLRRTTPSAPAAAAAVASFSD